MMMMQHFLACTRRGRCRGVKTLKRTLDGFIAAIERAKTRQRELEQALQQRPTQQQGAPYAASSSVKGRKPIMAPEFRGASTAP
eukprot:1158142-Pelagomonas_calceolata.AAC.3